MVETVDAQCELPQAQLFDSLGGAESPAIPIRRSSKRHEL
jgi:hypothetical protein